MVTYKNRRFPHPHLSCIQWKIAQLLVFLLSRSLGQEKEGEGRSRVARGTDSVATSIAHRLIWVLAFWECLGGYFPKVSNERLCLMDSDIWISSVSFLVVKACVQHDGDDSVIWSQVRGQEQNSQVACARHKTFVFKSPKIWVLRVTMLRRTM